MKKTAPPKCKVCGMTQRARTHRRNWRCDHEFVPGVPEERTPRLTIEVRPHYWARFVGQHVAFVHVDGYAFRTFTGTEPEARAAAQAYVDELIKHFQEGGR